MGIGRNFRLLEGSLVALLVIQAVRVVFAGLLGAAWQAFQSGETGMQLLLTGALFMVAAALAWLAPRKRRALPAALSLSAMIAAALRILMSLRSPEMRLYAGLAIIGVGGFYFASLLRANWRSWVSAWVVGLAFDQLFRAYDGFDLSLRAWLRFPVMGITLEVPWFVPQIVISLLLVIVSRLARRYTPREPHEPANLTFWSGLALGGFLALEMLVLAMPNVVARWAGVPYPGIVPWLLFATLLPLVPSVRHMMGRAFGLFDDRLRGWVWMFILLALLTVGNRLTGGGAAAALIAAQFIAVLHLWWLPSPRSPEDEKLYAPAVGVGFLVWLLLTIVYSLAVAPLPALAWLQGQVVVVVLTSAGLLALAHLVWREDDPWLMTSFVPAGLSLALILPLVFISFLLSSLGVYPETPRMGSTLRVATYNMNGGYDEGSDFQLELAARTIEASLADVIVLQEADVGRPISYGIDEVQFLARRLKMYQVYLPTVEQVRGIAILSRWPLEDPAGAAAYGERGESPGVVRAVIRDPLSEIEVMIVGAQLSPGDDDLRIQQYALLIELVGQTSPVFLAMDLGASPDDAIYHQLVTADGFLDPDAALGIERGYTTPAVTPRFRHDYVLLRGLLPLDSRQVDSSASDHRLVVVESGLLAD